MSRRARAERASLSRDPLKDRGSVTVIAAQCACLSESLRISEGERYPSVSSLFSVCIDHGPDVGLDSMEGQSHSLICPASLFFPSTLVNLQMPSRAHAQQCGSRARLKVEVGWNPVEEGAKTRMSWMKLDIRGAPHPPGGSR